ncbi:MAG TPA: leucine-rich repeat domain-containing protein [Verrucomicrobiae bacterium]|nr:leucine-rich repeat domain-containing protein [Verrucomicrobiae bacterium]
MSTRKSIKTGFLRFYCISALFLLLPVAGQAQFTYVTNSDGVSVTITSYTGSGGTAVIPAETNGFPVTGIGGYAFSEDNLLTNVTIGAGITNIGDYAFSDCTSLTAINVDASNPDYSGVDGVLFNQSRTALIQYPASKAGTCYTIPSGVINIGDAAFYFSLGLTNVIIPNGVTNIGIESFYDSENLLSINIPNSVTTIGAWAFWSCGSLNTVTIPANVTSVGSFAFLYCVSLDAVYFEGNAPSDGGGIFDNDNGVIVYYLPGTVGWGTTFSGVPAVDETPPYEFISVTNSDALSITVTGYTGSSDAVAIPPKINGYPVTGIGNQAFQGGGVTNIFIPTSITSIGDSAFEGCAGLTSIIIPNSVTNVGGDAFAQCVSLTAVYFRGSAPPDDGTAFYNDPAIVYYLPGTIGWAGTFGGVPAVEETATAPNEFNYVTNNNAITITGYTGPRGSVVIPDTINGYSVTGIGPDAFAQTTNIMSVTIPGSVTNIGDHAFTQCTSLTTVYFQGDAPPDNGTVFSGGPAIVYYLFGTTGWGATFGEAPAIEENASSDFTCVMNSDAVSVTITAYTGSESAVVIPNTINGYRVTSIGMNAFLQNMTLTNVTIPNGVTNIGDTAFGSCTNLTSAVLPESIISIGEESFGACFGLTQFTIPGNVTTIGAGVFDSCVSLSSITIPNSVTNIGEIAFENCVSMTNISVDADNPDYSSRNGILFDKAQGTLIECPAGLTVSDYTIPDGVVTIDPEAFVFCNHLASVTLPGSVTNILGPPFYGCVRLTNICVNATNPAYIALNGVLFDKSEDTVIEYPPGLTSTTYNIPTSVTTIQGDAFGFCANLVNITVPSSVSNIGEWGTFLGCSSLTSISIPYGVTNIPNSAFQGCSNLLSVIIPNSVTSIGWQAFSECTSLTNIVIPASVTTLGNFAFSFSGGLASVYFEGDAPPGNPSIFYNAPATVYYLPGTSGWGTTYGNVPTQLWYQSRPQVLTFEPSFGVQNQQFGFTISWATNANVIVQASTNLSNPVWIPVATNSLAGGTNYFSDPSWMNYPNRFYRISGQ